MKMFFLTARRIRQAIARKRRKVERTPRGYVIFCKNGYTQRNVSYFKASKLFLYAAIFCVIFVTSSTLFPFIVGKYVVFRTAVDLALITFLLGVIFRKHEWESLASRARRVFRHPLFIAVSVFVFFFLLASFFAYDPHAAFWSNFERGEGGLQMLHLYVFFLLLLLLFRTDEEWRKIFIASLFAAGGVILYGVALLLHIKGFIGPSDICARFQGSLGNPAYFAAYSMFLLFFSLWLWFSKKDGTKQRNGAYLFLVLVIGFLFFLSQTRGAFLGLGLAVIAALVYLAFSFPSGKQKRLFSILAIISIVLAIAAFMFRHENIPLVPFCNSSSRLLDFSVTEQSAQTRLWTWGSAIKGWKERPLLGWGPENFGVVFDKYFDTRHFIPNQNSETWFDRAHSVFFDYLVETGVLGFLSFLAIYVVFFVELFRNRREFITRSPRGILLSALLFAMPIAYLGQGVAMFDVLPIYLNVFLFLSFATHIFLKARDAKSPVRNQKQ